jgi:hypothetical protein
MAWLRGAVRIGAGSVVLLLTGAAAAAPLDVKPGLWEITTAGLTEVQQACLTEELLEADLSNLKMPAGVECSNEIREASAQRVVSHTVCTGAFAIEGDTTVEVQSRESMSMSSTSILRFGPAEQTINASASYRWLGADCGDVAPVDLKKIGG